MPVKGTASMLPPGNDSTVQENRSRNYIAAIAMVGATSLVTQVTFLREYLSLVQGNELVIGIILANWMLLTGIGAVLGKLSTFIQKKETALIVCMLLLSLLPIPSLFFLRTMRYRVFPFGTVLSIIDIVSGSFLLLMPYCILSGFLFTLLVRMVSERTNNAAAIYGWEAIGSVHAGIVFNLLLMFLLEPFQCLIALALCSGIVITLLLRHNHPRWLSAVFPFVFGAGLIFLAAANLDMKTVRALFPDQDILYSKVTPYGTLTVTEQAEQKNFYVNNTLLFSTGDATQNEEAVHYAMIQHPHPENILLISGGISGTIREILKYNINRVDYVELNPWLIDVGEKFIGVFDDNKIRVFKEDARMYVKATPERYDVVLVNIPEPSTSQLNRFYTVEFMKELHHILKPGAVVSFSLLPTVDYLGTNAKVLSSIFMNTLRTQFSHVLIVPGFKNFFLASESELHIDICRRITERNIPTVYVNRYYLDDGILKQRSEDIAQHLLPTTVVNTDFEPVSYQQYILFWLSYFDKNYLIFAFLAAAILAYTVRRINAVSFGMLTGGFAASAIEIILIITFQIIYGYVYQILGLIITAFMAGLALGSLLYKKIFRISSNRSYGGIQFMFAFLALCLPLILTWMNEGGRSVVLIHTMFYSLTILFGALIGMQFAAAVTLRKGDTSSLAGDLYGVDLTGSAIGALIVSAYLIPKFGTFNVCYLLSILCALGGLTAVVFGTKLPRSSIARN